MHTNGFDAVLYLKQNLPLSAENKGVFLNTRHRRNTLHVLGDSQHGNCEYKNRKCYPSSLSFSMISHVIVYTIGLAGKTQPLLTQIYDLYHL